jgi:flagellin-like protein
VPRRKGISPVIATVIIVAVTIAVAIAVAFWMTGIVGLFTATEKLEITSLYVTGGGGENWEVHLNVKNTGTTLTSIDNIFINGVPISQCTGSVAVDPDVTNTPVAINPGTAQDITITITPNSECGSTTFTSGVSIEVKLHSTGGKEYPKLTNLP